MDSNLKKELRNTLDIMRLSEEDQKNVRGGVSNTLGSIGNVSCERPLDFGEPVTCCKDCIGLCKDCIGFCEKGCSLCRDGQSR